MKFKEKIIEKIEEYFDFVAKSNNKKGKFYALTPLLVIIVIVFLTLVFLFSNWESRILWIRNKTNPNKILVEKSGLKRNELVSIKWTCESYCDTVLVYENGETINLNFKNSGNNIFLVFVNDSLVHRQIQYKNAFWKGYSYKFRISKNGNAFSTDIEINE